MPENKLKPCPFCGGIALGPEEFTVRKGFEASIVCGGNVKVPYEPCLAEMRSITYETQEEANGAIIKAWNRRQNER